MENTCYTHLFEFPSTKRHKEAVRDAYYRYIARQPANSKPDRLTDYYTKPSAAKQRIWDHWYKRLTNMRMIYWNNHYISFAGILSQQFGDNYFAYITPTHNFMVNIDTIDTL